MGSGWRIRWPAACRGRRECRASRAARSPRATWPAMPVGCRATPRARWAVGWVSGATPYRRADRPAGHRIYPQAKAGAPGDSRAVGAGALRSTALDLLCLLRANLDPATARWPSRSSAHSSPGSRRPNGWGRARLAAHPSAWDCRPPVVAQRRDQRLSQLVGIARESGTAVVALSNTARSVDRLGLRILKALPSAAG
jgi:hypothetical protein